MANQFDPAEIFPNSTEPDPYNRLNIVRAALATVGVTAAILIYGYSQDNTNNTVSQGTALCGSDNVANTLKWTPSETEIRLGEKFAFPTDENIGQGQIVIIQSDRDIKLQDIFPPDQFGTSDRTIIATLSKVNEYITVGYENEMLPYDNFVVYLNPPAECDEYSIANSLIEAMIEGLGLKGDNTVYWEIEVPFEIK